MIVPRGTSWPCILRDTPRATFRVTMLPYQLRALADGAKSQHRILISAENSTVHPGQFSGLDLSTGRARHAGGPPNLPQLRARCTFESGKTRAVTIRPRFIAGDLLWVYDPRGKRRGSSKFTLEVISVGVSRVQDMLDSDARAEGVGSVRPPAVMRFLTDVGQYGWHAEEWRRRCWPRRPDLWAGNPWVWVVLFAAHRVQVDRLLAQWGKR